MVSSIIVCPRYLATIVTLAPLLILTILSILIPILLSFYSKDGFDIYGFLNVIP